MAESTIEAPVGTSVEVNAQAETDLVAARAALATAQAEVVTAKAEALANKALADANAEAGAKALEIVARTGVKTGQQAVPAAGDNPVMAWVTNQYGPKA